MVPDRAAPRQLPLDLRIRPALGREAFFVAPCNADAVALIDAWRGWPGRKLVLAGPPGAGKTHLAHVWAAAAGARMVAAAGLTEAGLPALARGPIAVEGADAVAGDPAAERTLFHLHNLSATEGGTLLLTADTPPATWPLVLPDLRSRLEAAPLARIAPPDDRTLRAVLVKLFADRQLSPSPAVIDVLAQRMDRSFAGARELVARLDAAALAERSAVTRPLALRILREMPQ